MRRRAARARCSRVLATARDVLIHAAAVRDYALAGVFVPAPGDGGWERVDRPALADRLWDRLESI
jgi:hypothetical protein